MSLQTPLSSPSDRTIRRGSKFSTKTIEFSEALNLEAFEVGSRRSSTAQVSPPELPVGTGGEVVYRSPPIFGSDSDSDDERPPASKALSPAVDSDKELLAADRGAFPDLDGLESAFKAQTKTCVTLLKAKLFAMLDLFNSPEEAEANLQLINDLRAEPVSQSVRKENHWREVDSIFRFGYEEIALRWHAHTESLYSTRVLSRVAAEEVNRRVEAQQREVKSKMAAEKLRQQLTVAEEVTRRRKAAYAENLKEYHQELHILHTRLQDLQKRLDVRETAPKLLNDGETDEDNVMKKFERNEKMHLEFMYRKANEELQLYRRSLEERSTLIQALEEELETERTEAVALRREFRHYLEEQEHADTEFRSAVQQQAELLNSERAKTEDFARKAESLSLELEDLKSKHAQCQIELDGLRAELNEANEMIAMSPSRTFTPEGTPLSPSTSTAKLGKKSGGKSSGKLSAKSGGKKSELAESPSASDFNVASTAEYVALEAAHTKLQKIAEERRVDLEEATKMKKMLHLDLEMQKTELHDTKARLKKMTADFEKFQLDTKKKEQAAQYERERERTFLKKKAGDLQEKLAAQEELMDGKLMEMKDVEAELVEDIMTMHKQFATVENFLLKRFGDGLLDDLSHALEQDSTNEAHHTPRTREYFNDEETGTGASNASGGLRVSGENFADDAMSNASGRSQGTTRPTAAILAQRPPLRPGSAGGLSDSGSRTVDGDDRQTAGRLRWQNVFAKSRVTQKFLQEHKDHINKLRDVKSASNSEVDDMEDTRSRNSLTRKASLRKNFRDAVMSQSMSVGGFAGDSGIVGGMRGVSEVETENLNMVVQDLLSQQAQHFRANEALKKENSDLRRRVEELKEDRSMSPTTLKPTLGVKAPRSRPASASPARSFETGDAAVGSKPPSHYVSGTPLPAPETISDMSTHAPIDLTVVQMFPGVEVAMEYFDLFETFVAIRRQLTQLVLVCGREIDQRSLPDSTEMMKVILHEKFTIFRAIETHGGALVTKLHKKKEDIMRRREEEIEKVLSTLQCMSVTHPKEAAKLTRIARQAAAARDNKAIVESRPPRSRSRAGIEEQSTSATMRSVGGSSSRPLTAAGSGIRAVAPILSVEIERPATSMAFRPRTATLSSKSSSH